MKKLLTVLLAATMCSGVFAGAPEKEGKASGLGGAAMDMIVMLAQDADVEAKLKITPEQKIKIVEIYNILKEDFAVLHEESKKRDEIINANPKKSPAVKEAKKKVRKLKLSFAGKVAKNMKVLHATLSPEQIEMAKVAVKAMREKTKALKTVSENE